MSANKLAKWDSTNWSALGDGCDSTVGALAVDSDDNLYVAGLLTSAGSCK